MIYLIFCILISVAILTFFRLFDRFFIDRNNTIILSYFISFLLAFFSRDLEFDFKNLPGFQWFYIGILLGVTFYIGFQLFALSTKKIGLAITSVSGNLSVIVPVIIAMIFYHESTSFSKIAGLILTLLSFYLIFKPNKNIKIGIDFIYLPFLLFTFNGINASLLSYGEKVGAGKFMMVFMALIFLSAGIFGFATNFFNKKRNKINYQSIIASIALGALNYASTITILKSLTFYADSIFFPIYNSGYITISALVGFILFKEKLRGVNFLGIALAMIAIIIITSGI